MTRTPLALALVAAAALAGCNQEDHTIVAGGPADPMGNQANADVVLPPAIAHSKIYRCKDNSVVYVDFMSDNKIAVFRRKKGGDAVTLRAPEAGQPFEAEGHRIVGNSGQVSITAPGLGSQTCKA